MFSRVSEHVSIRGERLARVFVNEKENRRTYGN